MNRRSFFALPLSAVIPNSFSNEGAKLIHEVPKPGDVMRAPVGALEVSVGGKIYHAYLWEPQK